MNMALTQKFIPVTKFNSVEDLKVYVMNPDHQAFMKEVTGPIMKSFASIQFETE